VTGARQEFSPDLTEYLERARRAMEKPFVVGFGISNRAQIDRVVPPAAGVVVGSALLRALAGEADAPGRRRRAEGFLKELRNG
jgi:tryptophan synthase alpha chain